MNIMNMNIHDIWNFRDKKRWAMLQILFFHRRYNSVCNKSNFFSSRDTIKRDHLCYKKEPLPIWNNFRRTMPHYHNTVSRSHLFQWFYRGTFVFLGNLHWSHVKSLITIKADYIGSYNDSFLLFLGLYELAKRPLSTMANVRHCGYLFL